MSHPQAVVRNTDRQTQVHLEASDFVAAEDFLVSYQPSASEAVRVSAYHPDAARAGPLHVSERSAGARESSYFAPRLIAAAEGGMPAPQQRDRVLVVDTSHGQRPATLARVRVLASELLRRMPKGDRYAILACDSACASYPRAGLLEPASENQRSALRWLGQRRALGASDPGGAIGQACRRLNRGRSNQVICVGDGTPTAGDLAATDIARHVRLTLRANNAELSLVASWDRAS